MMGMMVKVGIALCVLWCCAVVVVVEAKAIAALPLSAQQHQVHILASSRFDSSNSDDDNGNSDSNDNSGSVSGDGAGPSKSKGIQIMVTQRMRRVLEDELGYTADEVDAMEPQIAAVVIERGLARPTAGMPKSWRKKRTWSPIVSKDVLANVKNRVKAVWRALKGPATFVAQKVAPAVLVGGAVLLALPRALDLLGMVGAALLYGLNSAASVRLTSPKLPALSAARQQPVKTASQPVPTVDERPRPPARAPAKAATAAAAAPKPPGSSSSSSSAAAAAVAARAAALAMQSASRGGRGDYSGSEDEDGGEEEEEEEDEEYYEPQPKVSSALVNAARVERPSMFGATPPPPTPPPVTPGGQSTRRGSDSGTDAGTDAGTGTGKKKKTTLFQRTVKSLFSSGSKKG